MQRAPRQVEPGPPSPVVAVGDLELRAFDASQAWTIWNGLSPVPSASGYPLPGSRGAAAVVLARDGAPVPGGLTMFLLTETDSDLVVGDAGFHAPPEHGEVEIGYGVVPGRRGRGYARWVVAELLRLAWACPQVDLVIAQTEFTNTASRAALTRNGFRVVEQNGDVLLHHLARPL